MISQIRPLYADYPIPNIKLDNEVFALDSTTISLSLVLFQWAPGKYSRGAVKIHTLLDLRGSIPSFVLITDGKYHDSNVLDVLAPIPGAIYLMDKAYIDFEALYSIHLAGAFFVSRAKSNMNYTVTCQNYNINPVSYNANEHRWGDGRAKICHYELLCNGRVSTGLMERGDQLIVRLSVLFEQDIDKLIYGITVKTSDGTAVYGTNSRLVEGLPKEQGAGDLVSFEFALTLNLLAGDYFISLGVAQDDEKRDNVAVDRRYDMIHVHVKQTPDAFGTAALEGVLSLLETR